MVWGCWWYVNASQVVQQIDNSGPQIALETPKPPRQSVKCISLGAPGPCGGLVRKQVEKSIQEGVQKSTKI